jgi:Leucine-rich repeat (LRR) protein
MTRDSKLPKRNSLLPSTIYKQLIILLLVTSSTTQSPSASYECPRSCECNEINFSARCDDLEELINSYNQKQHKSRHNFMPIKSLDLSNNQLTKLTNQLELLVNLTELNLSHNQLTQVHKLNFDKLEKLDLSHNRITSAKLKKLPKNVIHLNLAHNEITYLPVDFMKLKKLRSLELVGNPLNCTCNTLHVRNWITLQHVWSDNHILCASPVTGIFTLFHLILMKLKLNSLLQSKVSHGFKHVKLIFALNLHQQPPNAASTTGTTMKTKTRL